MVGPDGKSLKPVTVYRGLDAVDNFLHSITAEEVILTMKLLSVKPLQLTREEEEAFQAATVCYICKKELGEDRVRNHCHITGKYREALHKKKCNFRFKLRKIIPIVFYNLKNYDGHLIMQHISNFKDYDLQVIPTTMEKYISFSMSKKCNEVRVCLHFIDSFQFLSSSL